MFEDEYTDPDWFNNYGVEVWSEDEEEETESQSDENKSVQPEEEPQPEKKDRFFELYKTSEFFKIDKDFRFYILREGKWNYCPPMRDVYFDAASDYWEINYDPAEERRGRGNAP
jgi:hypothetical protein